MLTAYRGGGHQRFQHRHLLPSRAHEFAAHDARRVQDEQLQSVPIDGYRPEAHAQVKSLAQRFERSDGP